MCCRPVYCLLAFLFLGTLRNFFTNVCTWAHLRMCLLHCIYASSFALTTLIHFVSFLVCFQVHSDQFDSEFKNQTVFRRPVSQVCFSSVLYQPPPPPPTCQDSCFCALLFFRIAEPEY